MNTEIYDVIIIGGGSTGLGVAVESASRGYKTLLLEAYDYGKGTSSKSTKLVHGGIRYLANFDFSLVKEGLEERYFFLKNAPHLAHAQRYLIPFHNWFEKLEYHIGIRLYDFLAGRLKIGKSRFFSKKEILAAAPNLNPKHIVGGGLYFDGQFDDTRMLVTLLKTFESLGGVALNYHCVTGIAKSRAEIWSITTQDVLNTQELVFHTKVLINATGIFTDTLLNLADSKTPHSTVEPAQGTHLVFDKDIFNCEYALLIPKTVDGRILFVLPWHDKVLVGTTDVHMDHPSIDPTPQAEEIELILSTLNQYTKHKVTRQDIRSIFVGQRPLVKPAHAKNTKKISRRHEVFMTQKGFITIVGGKWTIYRRMGEDTIDFAIKAGLLPKSISRSKNLLLSGATTTPEAYPFSVYGTDAKAVHAIETECHNTRRLHPDLPYFEAEIIYHIRHEQAKTVEDVLARRTRALFLNAKAAIEAAPIVAALMARHLKKDEHWVKAQVSTFNQLAYTYCPF